MLFRDLEGTKLLPDRHAAALAALPEAVARLLTYAPERGWDRVVYCLLVNHLAEMLAALADLHPGWSPPCGPPSAASCANARRRTATRPPCAPWSPACRCPPRPTS
ncbi:IucA/IucC family C-terminal-domain containing protein [Streptomyces sp. M19]